MSKEQERRSVLMASEVKMNMTRWILAHNLPDKLHDGETLAERESRRSDRLARTAGQLEASIQKICDRIIELEAGCDSQNRSSAVLVSA